MCCPTFRRFWYKKRFIRLKSINGTGATWVCRSAVSGFIHAGDSVLCHSPGYAEMSTPFSCPSVLTTDLDSGVFRFGSSLARFWIALNTALEVAVETRRTCLLRFSAVPECGSAFHLFGMLRDVSKAKVGAKERWW